MFGFGQQQPQQPQQQQQQASTGFGSAFGAPSGFGATTGFGSTAPATSGFGGFGGSASSAPTATSATSVFGQPATSAFPATSLGVGGSSQVTSATSNQGTGQPQYTSTTEKDPVTAPLSQTYHCISMMPAYKNWSFEELRLRDYELNKKYAGAVMSSGFGSSAFGQPAATTAPTTSAFGQTTPATSSAFGQPTTTGFGAAPSTTTSAFGATTASPFGGASTTTGSAFGTTASTGGLFGQPAATAAPTTSTSSFGFGSTPASTTSQPGMFGQPAATTTTSLFGQPQQQQASTGLFGSTTTTGMFGQPSTTTPSTGGLFGQPQQQQQQQQGLFGQPATTTQPSTGIFGQPSATTTSAFGQPATTTTQPSTGLFGQPAATATSGFGGTTTSTGLFGQPAASTAQQPKPAFGTGLFGQQATTPTVSTTTTGFGTTPSTGTTGLFGQAQTSTTTASTTGFGGATTTGAGMGLFGTKPTTGFGSTTTTTGATTGGLFGQAASTATQPTTTLAPLSTGTTGTTPSFGFGGSSTATGGTSTSLFGTPATSTATAGTGLFGTAAKPTTTFGFGGSTTTAAPSSTAPTTTGLGGSLFQTTTTQPSTGGGGLFGTSFGLGTSTLQSQTQQQQQGQQPGLVASIESNAYGTNPLLQPSAGGVSATGQQAPASTTVSTAMPSSAKKKQVLIPSFRGRHRFFPSTATPAKPVAPLTSDTGVKDRSDGVKILERTSPVRDHVAATYSVDQFQVKSRNVKKLDISSIRSLGPVQSLPPPSLPDENRASARSSPERPPSSILKKEVIPSTQKKVTWRSTLEEPEAGKDKSPPKSSATATRLYPDLSADGLKPNGMNDSFLRDRSVEPPTPVRRIDFGALQSAQPSLVSTKDASWSVEEASTVLPDDLLQPISREASPLRTDTMYSMSPDLATLSQMSMQELKRIHNFTVMHQEWGSVRWLQPVDLSVFLTDIPSGKLGEREKRRRLARLPGHIVKFDKKLCMVYEDEECDYHKQGVGLNTPAEISLRHCFAIDRQTRQPVTDPNSAIVAKHIHRLESLNGTDFVGFDALEGLWTFRVQHFSRYGLVDDDGYDEDTGNQDAFAAEDLPADTNQQSYQEEEGQEEFMEEGENETFSPSRRGLMEESMYDADPVPFFDDSVPIYTPKLPVQLQLDKQRLHSMRSSLFPLTSVAVDRSPAKYSPVQPHVSVNPERYSSASHDAHPPQFFSPSGAKLNKEHLKPLSRPVVVSSKPKSFSKPALTAEDRLDMDYMKYQCIRLPQVRSYAGLKDFNALEGNKRAKVAFTHNANTKVRPVGFFWMQTAEGRKISLLTSVGKTIKTAQLTFGAVCEDEQILAQNKSRYESWLRTVLNSSSHPLKFAQFLHKEERFSHEAETLSWNGVTREEERVMALGRALVDPFLDESKSFVEAERLQKRLFSLFLEKHQRQSVKALSNPTNHADQILTSLLQHRIKEAVQKAVAGGFLHLATVVAQLSDFGLGDEQKEDIYEFLEALDSTGLKQNLPILDSYRLLCADVHDLHERYQLTWMQSLGLYLWFWRKSFFAQPLSQCVEAYLLDCGQDQGQRPWYAEFSGDKNGSSLLFQFIEQCLLLTSIDKQPPLKHISYYPQFKTVKEFHDRDMGWLPSSRLGWHILSQIRSMVRAYNNESEDSKDVPYFLKQLESWLDKSNWNNMTTAYVLELEQMGLWQWACFVAMQIDQNEHQVTKDKLVQEILNRHLDYDRSRLLNLLKLQQASDLFRPAPSSPEPSPSLTSPHDDYRTLLQQYRLSPYILLKSLYQLALHRQDWLLASYFMLRAGQPELAHALLYQHVWPRLYAHSQWTELSVTLQWFLDRISLRSIDPLFVPLVEDESMSRHQPSSSSQSMPDSGVMHSLEKEVWSLGGGVYLDFMRMVVHNTPDSHSSDQQNDLSARLRRLLSRSSPQSITHQENVMPHFVIQDMLRRLSTLNRPFFAPDISQNQDDESLHYHWSMDNQYMSAAVH